MINRRGTFDLEGKGLHQLHELFAPHLDGSRDESELIAAAGPDRESTVRSYLRTLRRSGALVDCADGRPAGGRDLRELGPDRPHGCFRVGSHSVFVALVDEDPADAESAMEADSALGFLPPETAARRLMRWQRDDDVVGRGRGQILVVTSTEGVPDGRELDRRARIARFLLSSAAAPRDGLGRLQVFRMGSSGVALKRAASIDLASENGETETRDPEPSGIDCLPDQLDVVTGDGYRQLPLVVARARRPFGEPFGTRHYGLHFEEVRESVLHHFAGSECKTGDFLVGKVGSRTAEVVPTEREFVGSESPRLHHAGRREHLWISLLEERESRRPLSNHHRVDLLRVPGDPRVRCLQALLALHFRSLPAERTSTPGGATVFQTETLRTCSFFAERALLEVLLRALDAVEYGGAEPGIPVVPYPTESGAETEIGRILDEFSQVDLALCRKSLWGRLTWSGYLLAKGDPS